MIGDIAAINKAIEALKNKKLVLKKCRWSVGLLIL